MRDYPDIANGQIKRLADGAYERLAEPHKLQEHDLAFITIYEVRRLSTLAARLIENMGGGGWRAFAERWTPVQVLIGLTIIGVTVGAFQIKDALEFIGGLR